MNNINLDVIDVKTYYEKAKVSTKYAPFKIAVLKVKYSNETWDVIYRKVLSYTALNSTEINFIEQYKSLELNQIRQISSLLDGKDKKIFVSYLKKCLKCDLNINAFIPKRDLKIYIENKKTNMLVKAKNVFQHINISVKKIYSPKNVTNI